MVFKIKQKQSSNFAQKNQKMQQHGASSSKIVLVLLPLEGAGGLCFTVYLPTFTYVTHLASEARLVLLWASTFRGLILAVLLLMSQGVQEPRACAHINFALTFL